jgi:pimeloyl-ACP methyl ester carboxylesterase
VLIHGSISDRTYWTPVIPPLAERFTVITVDRRGRGGSGDFFTGLGPALIAGASAVLVAYLTVRWTLAGTQKGKTRLNEENVRKRRHSS